MHEFSIINSLIDLCEKNAKENNAKKITKVEVKIGKLSGVEPYLFETAFHTFKEQTICDGAELVMHLQDLVIHCSACNKESILEKNDFKCPLCQSNDMRVIEGEDMLLMSLEME